MAGISYFEEEISVAGKNAKADGKLTNIVEIYVGSFSGNEELYLKNTDVDGKESCSIISKEQAERMLDGLRTAMLTLGYCE